MESYISVSEVAYIFFFLAILFHFICYPALLVYIKIIRPQSLNNEYQNVDSNDLPHISIVVCVYNEESLIEKKLVNLLELDYPEDKIRIMIIDGDSDDNTAAIVEGTIERNANPVELYKTKIKGKINQLNYALNKIPNDHLVVVTDADAIITKKCSLVQTVGIFRNNSNIGLVGGWNMPGETNKFLCFDKAHWNKQNRMRHIESVCYSSSIVVAPYYSFFRSLVDNFPDDCIADDIYISFLCHLKQKRIIYASEIDIIELRQPKSIRELVTHKARKANAYTMELLRIIYRIPQMGKRFKFYYLCQLFQFFYLPWAIIGFIVFSLVALANEKYFLIASTYLSFTLLAIIISSAHRSPKNRTRGGIGLRPLIDTIGINIIIIAVLIANTILYAFWRQNSIYSKVKGIDLE